MTEMLTEREKILVVSTAVIAFIAGMWAGVWSVPMQALDVPQELVATGESPPDPAYTPAPTWLLPLSFTAVGMLVFWLRLQLRSDDAENVDDLDLEDPRNG